MGYGWNNNLNFGLHMRHRTIFVPFLAIALLANMGMQAESLPFCPGEDQRVPDYYNPGIAYEETSCFNQYFWSTVIIGSAVVAVVIVALTNTPSSHSH